MNFVKRITYCFLCLYCAIPSFAQTADSTSFYPTASTIDSTSNSTTDSASYYTSVHYKGSANIVLGEELQGCQFNVISVIDSFLYVQINIAGLEVGRVLAKPDNFLFINKLQKKYYEGDYSFLEYALDTAINFFMLQEIFNGVQPFYQEGLVLTYQRDSISYEYPFFNMLLCESYGISLKLNVKKVTFNAVPEVNAIIPKNYTLIDISN